MNRKTLEAVKEIVLKPMLPVERPAPNGDTCTKCGNDQIVVISALAWGPWSGKVKCKKCGYEEKTMSHIGKKFVTVEPLKI